MEVDQSKKAEYNHKKKQVADEMRAQAAQGAAIGLGKDTSNLFRHREQGSVAKINVRNFNQVIAVDTDAMIAEVEGMTTYEELVNETLKFGVMPAVVPELKTITIGGAVTGVGIESSSFRYGLVHETIQEIEVLLSDGSVVVATPENEHKDIFFGFPNSYGSLGYILKLKVKVVPVRPYVRVVHTKYSDADEYYSALESLVRENREKGSRIDFIDGSIFGPDEMYITTGSFVDAAPYTSDYTHLKMYFKSIQKRTEDFLTVHDYIWRWDTDWFWCSKHFYVQNPITRLFVGRKRLCSKNYWKIRAWAGRSKVFKTAQSFSKTLRESVVQDVEIPIQNCGAFMDFFHKEIGITPVWVCPTMAYNPDVRFDLYPMDPDVLYVNFGFWDMVDTDTDKDPWHFNKLIEQKVEELNGKKSLYSTAHYSKEKFWQLYNKPAYDRLKSKYDPQGRLRGLFEKTVGRK